MTREQKIARARVLRNAKPPLPYREIGERLGVSTGTAFRWVNPERVAPYRNGRAINPERARELDRRYKLEQRAECPRCSSKMSPRSSPCEACGADEVDRRARKIEHWWSEGLLLREIAANLNWSLGHLSGEMHRYRELGYRLPYRYTESKRRGRRFPEQVAA